MQEFKPTYLCVKEHSVTGLKYLCKTTRDYEKMLKYRGSGTRWTNHIKKHGRKYVETPWFCLFYDAESIKEFALMCSEQWDIVNAKDIIGKKIWANKKLEDGLMGGGNGGANKGKKLGPQSAERRANKSIELLGNINGKGGKGISRNKGTTQSKEHIKNRVDKNKGKRRSPKQKENISIGMIGKNSGPQETAKCPYCPKEGGISNMKRWHFDNCKKRIK